MNERRSKCGKWETETISRKREKTACATDSGASKPECLPYAHAIFVTQAQSYGIAHVFVSQLRII